MKGINRNVWYMGVVSGLTDVSSEMLYPVIPLFLTTVLGAPMSVVGLIEGTAEATASLLKAAGGRLSDRLRRRKPFVVFGYGLSALSKPVLAFASAWPLVMVSRFFDRVGKGVRTAPRDALIAASCAAEHRGLAFGLHRAMDTAGAALGPLVSLFLLESAHWSYRRVFLFSFIPAALGVAVLWAFVKEKPAAEEIGASPAPGRQGGSLSPELKRFLRAYSLFALGNSSDVFLLLKAKSCGFSTTQVLLAYVAYNVVYAALAAPAGRLSDRLGRARTLSAGLGVFAAVYLGFAFVQARTGLWALFMLYGVYAAMMEGVAAALVADLSGPADRGTAMGYFQGLAGVLAFAASAAAGLLWTHLSPAAPFVMGACGAAASSLALRSGRLSMGAPRPKD